MAHGKHEDTMQLPPQGLAPVTTIIEVQPEVSVPDHIIWSMFNSLFMNFCCLSFMAFAYLVKVSAYLVTVDQDANNLALLVTKKKGDH